LANTYTYFERTAGTQHNNAADWTQINKNIAAVISSIGTAAPTVALDRKLNIANVLNASSTATDKPFSANYITDNYSTGGASGGKPDFLLDVPAGKFYVPTGSLALAPLNVDVGSNIEDIPAHLQDGATDEGVNYYFRLPPDANTGGTVTIEWLAYVASTASTGTVVESIKFSPISVAGDESWDQAYGTPVASSAVVMDTVDRVEYFSATASYSTVFGAINKYVALQTFRDVSADTMAIDANLMHLRIRIPLS
jgi:hypothetical protein